MIAKKYAEPSKVFTVKDSDGKEVLYLGKPGNTDKELSAFANSPTDYMMNKAHTPEDGYYVFIGGFNADYHSFTVIYQREGSQHNFWYIDQIDGVEIHHILSLEKKWLDYIYRERSNYPMCIELY